MTELSKLFREKEWLARVSSDPEFKQTSRWTDVTFVITVDGEKKAYRVHAATLSPADVAAGEAIVELEGSTRVWCEFLKPFPPPHHHHVLAMDRRCDDFSIASGRHALIQNLRVLTIVLDLMRTCGVQPEASK
ncbi:MULTISPECIES: hypothetical protein [unclassified Caballeronia]|uniref:hypothetical protein n=1 Tax=unclassified Caballeronia TaxID=2646786 RepID=UPI002029434D|nr:MULTISPECIES: hypothetical protein [unclassified Caballeronia]MDR5765854.1 hypothetical protein [Caballeronia sp. LZ028]